MNQVAGLVVAILATAVGLLGTLMWEVLFLAGSPNSSPQQLATIRMWMWIALAGGVVCLAAAIWLMVIGRYWWASGIGVLPMASFVVMLVVVSVK